MGAVLAVSVAPARPQDAAEEATATRGEVLQQDLESRAIRIPVSPPTRSETTVAGDEAALATPPAVRRGDPAEIVRRGADWRAVRDTLSETAVADNIRAQQGAAPAEITADRGRFEPPPAPPGLRSAAEQLRAALPAPEIARVEAPLLIPAGLREEFNIYGMQNIYTAVSAIDQNAYVSISGTCNRVIGGDPNIVEARRRLAEGPPQLPGLRAEYHISRNDFGTDLSFSKFGCGYVVTIECSAPSRDPRCASDDYIIGLADSMVLVNAERAEQNP